MQERTFGALRIERSFDGDKSASTKFFYVGMNFFTPIPTKVVGYERGCGPQFFTLVHQYLVIYCDRRMSWP